MEKDIVMTEKKFKMRQGMYRLDVDISNYDCLNCTSVNISVDAVYVNPLTENKKESWLGSVEAKVIDNKPAKRYRLLKETISRKLKSLATEKVMKRILKEMSDLLVN